MENKRKKLSTEEQDRTFFALKLIEALLKDGKIKPHVFKNILNEYKDVIDVSRFSCYG